jgi:hypothetical protein
LHKTIPHIYTRNGVFCVPSRVPRSVHVAYAKPKIIFSLKIRCPIVAEQRVKTLIARLENHGFTLRLQTDPDLALHLGLRPAATAPLPNADQQDEREPKGPIAVHRDQN